MVRGISDEHVFAIFRANVCRLHARQYGVMSKMIMICRKQFLQAASCCERISCHYSRDSFQNSRTQLSVRENEYSTDSSPVHSHSMLELLYNSVGESTVLVE
jgi:hypothetical protein